ncbi:three-helix bundle dimerization domain-containing protein [Nocardioides ungokensis]|uniref:three-helix bundle dimerization domain-containing protein n=1 Tax=Nocardioides ungokensis TaxID=1643322 RepID=UPI0015DEF9E0|nr:hypothetical protein [Nocardioides ungokensis]
MDPTSDEARLVGQVERDLRDEFPQVPPNQIETLVECLWAHYDGARIRDFVPQLVFRQVREELLEDVGATQPAPPTAPPEATLATSSRWSNDANTSGKSGAGMVTPTI